MQLASPDAGALKVTVTTGLWEVSVVNDPAVQLAEAEALLMDQTWSVNPIIEIEIATAQKNLNAPGAGELFLFMKIASFDNQDPTQLFEVIK